jgi:hypothetical protein
VGKGHKNRPTNGVGNYMAVRIRPVIGDPAGNREQRRAAARMARRKGKQPAAYWQPKDDRG